MQNDALLYNAFEQYHQILVDRLPKEEDFIEIALSPQLEKRMEKLLKRKRSVYHLLFNTALKRVACILAAVIVTGSAVALSVNGDKPEPSYFEVQSYSENGVALHFFNIDLPYESLQDPIAPKAPSYLPKGYALAEDRSELRQTKLFYVGEGTDCFYYVQYPNGSDAYAGAEDAVCKRIKVGKYEGYLLKSESCTHLIFNDGEYLYQLNGTLTEKELLKVAKSIK